MIRRANFNRGIKLLYHKLFFYQRRVFETKRLEKGIKKTLRTDPLIKAAKKDNAYLSDVKQFLRSNFGGYKNTDWHHYYSCLNGIKDLRYIPDGLFFTTLIDVYNRIDLHQAYTDKTSYDIIFNKNSLPETVFKLHRGRIFDGENNLVMQNEAIRYLQNLNEELIVKPAIFSGGGKNILVDFAKNIADLISKNPDYSEGSYVIQKMIIQHKEMAKFHPQSVNTCRIMTARIGSEIVVLGAYFRIGRGNTKVDNGGQGGIMCSIDPSGQISEYAIDMEGKRQFKHEDSGLKYIGFIVPGYKKAVDFCKSYHKQILRFKIISWDIAIDENKNPIFIEYNFRRPAIHGHQILDGPLFGQHTQYFINYYHKHKENKNFIETF